jgi:hypothetical protein
MFYTYALCSLGVNLFIFFAEKMVDKLQIGQLSLINCLIGQKMLFLEVGDVCVGLHHFDRNYAHRFPAHNTSTAKKS